MTDERRVFTTTEESEGHKFLKCYNRQQWRWYLAKAKLIVPTNSTIVYPKRYHHDKDFDKFYEIPNTDVRTDKIKITHIEKENEHDTCIPLYYELMHKEKIKYEEGKTYETKVDKDVEKEAGNGFHFTTKEEDLNEIMESANYQVQKYNSRNIFSKVYHHLFG